MKYVTEVTLDFKGFRQRFPFRQVNMQAMVNADHWLAQFPMLRAMAPGHQRLARAHVHFLVLEAGSIAYRQDEPCPNYLMCLEGRTRVFKLSPGGRELLIYKVAGGGTCLLTTQCLLSGTPFPAESIAEEPTTLAALPAAVFHELMRASPPFRTAVLDDYAKLMGSMFALVDDLAFASLEQRLARRLLADADTHGVITKTHQQIAADLGTVREVVSRQLGEWERAGLVSLERGQVLLRDRAALAGR
jgi:CRP/FNR family transcriptional regulator, anaerobic regulatory protein